MVNFGVSGGGSKKKGTISTTSTTTPKYQEYTADIVKTMTPRMLDAYKEAYDRYANVQGFNPEQQQAWQETLQQMSLYGPEGPYAQYANQYLQPYLGAGWMQQLDPYYTAQRAELEQAVPLEQAQFWQDMKRELGPLWGTSGRGLEQTAEAYGSLRAQQQQRFADIEAQKAAASMAGAQFTAGALPTYAEMMDPTKWGEERISWLSMPEQYMQAQRQAELAALTPWSEWLGQATEMGYRYPQSVTETSLTKYSEKSGGSGGSAGCCFMFLEGNLLMPYVRKYRDEHYPKTSVVSKGYRIMSSLVVPWMRKSKMFKKLMTTIMLKPLAKAFKAYYDKSPLFYALLPFELFWCQAVWGGLGRLPFKFLTQYTWEKYYKGLSKEYILSHNVYTNDTKEV